MRSDLVPPPNTAQESGGVQDRHNYLLQQLITEVQLLRSAICTAFSLDPNSLGLNVIQSDALSDINQPTQP